MVIFTFDKFQPFHYLNNNGKLQFVTPVITEITLPNYSFLLLEWDAHKKLVKQIMGVAFVDLLQHEWFHFDII